MFPDETAAAELVARVTGARVEERPSGRHDADLTLPSGRTIGLEVTQAADQQELETWAAIKQRRSDRSSQLSRWWSVALRSGASVTDAHTVLPAQLARFERARVTEWRWIANPYGAPSKDPEVRDAEDILRRVGVDHAYSVEPRDGGGLSIVAHKDGGPVGGQDVVEAIEGEAWKSDNRSKLVEMTTDERQLFIWIDYSRSAAHVVLRSAVGPIPAPHLPPELTTLWVAARMSDDRGGWCAEATRRLDPPGSWVTI